MPSNIRRDTNPEWQTTMTVSQSFLTSNETLLGKQNLGKTPMFEIYYPVLHLFHNTFELIFPFFDFFTKPVEKHCRVIRQHWIQVFFKSYVFHHEGGITALSWQLPFESQFVVKVRVLPIKKFLQLMTSLKYKTNQKWFNCISKMQNR